MNVNWCMCVCVFFADWIIQLLFTLLFDFLCMWCLWRAQAKYWSDKCVPGSVDEGELCKLTALTHRDYADVHTQIHVQIPQIHKSEARTSSPSYDRWCVLADCNGHWDMPSHPVPLPVHDAVDKQVKPVWPQRLHGNLLINLRDLPISLHSGRIVGASSSASCKCLYINTSWHEYAWWQGIGRHSSENMLQWDFWLWDCD